MKVLGNTIWPIFGSLGVTLGYFASSLVLMITVIGIPSGIAMMKFGIFALWSFGSYVIDRPQGSGYINVFINMLWFFIGGIWVVLTHFGFGLLLGITIVGISWAKMHFRLMRLALIPSRKQTVNGNP